MMLHWHRGATISRLECGEPPGHLSFSEALVEQFIISFTSDAASFNVPFNWVGTASPAKL
jgi:hypothetical protein